MHLIHLQFSSQFNGGTIFVDHGSGYVDMQHQVSLNAGETIMAKWKFEHIVALYGVLIQSYHRDNGVFKSAGFQEELTLHQQTISFSGTGAHHQNGIAEYAIQQTTLWARAMLLHALIMWPNKTKIYLLPFALSYAAYLWNHITKHDSGLSPFDILSGCISSAIANYLVVSVCFGPSSTEWAQNPKVAATLLPWTISWFL